jgi:hypothetical protein
MKGEQSVSFLLGGRKFSHVFLVRSLPSEAAGLIGTDFMNETGAVIDFECKRMSLAEVDRMTRAHSVFPTGRTVLSLYRG